MHHWVILKSDVVGDADEVKMTTELRVVKTVIHQGPLTKKNW